MNSPLTAAETELATYAYSYPHKSSYRTLTPSVLISDAWRNEDVSQLSLYVHVPFCEMRCGFCNLFTQSQPQTELVDAYLATLKRQIRIIKTAVPDARFSQFAIGGGTPTFLKADQLQTLLSDVAEAFGQPIQLLPTSVETSPATATADRLRILSEFGVQRISLGIQSFLDTETRQIGRPQRTNDVLSALDQIREFGFPVLNLDLIYGHPQQTRESWRASMRLALQYLPEEFYLYPLYIRPETGLALRGDSAPAHRDDLYQLACELLDKHGYAQTSLRCFRRPQVAAPSTYTCQRDGMIGLGCGARSYTRRLHHATRFAVTQAGVQAILKDWITQSDADLALATHGIWLSEEEQLRRYVIMSLLQIDGLQFSELSRHFPSSDVWGLSELNGLIERGWLSQLPDCLQLTPEGLAHSDFVGPLLYSEPVRERLRHFIQLTTKSLPSPR